MPEPRHSWLIWMAMGRFAGVYSRIVATNSPRLEANTSAVATARLGANRGIMICPASIRVPSNWVTLAVAIRVSNGRKRMKYASGRM